MVRARRARQPPEPGRPLAGDGELPCLTRMRPAVPRTEVSVSTLVSLVLDVTVSISPLVEINP